MKRYIRAEHNPYPTTTFNVVGWKSSGQETPDLDKSFPEFSDALKFAQRKWEYYRIDINKETKYDDEKFPSSVRVCQFKYGKEQNRSFV